MNRIIAILLCSIALLLMLGTVMLYSSTTHQINLARVQQHLCWIGAGAVSCALASFINYSWLRKWHTPKWLLAIALFLLAGVFVPGLGVTKNGAARWLLWGQPSELAKVALIIFLADYAANHQGRMDDRNEGFIRPALIAALVIVLVFVEPDWGTAALMGAVTFAMLVLAGARWRYLLPAAAAATQLFVLLLLHNPLRLERILAFLDPEKYQDGIGWQGWHSILSLGSGGWIGTFFGEGSHKNGFVPEESNDFILSLIGEELGFAGAFLVLLLFGIIFLCGMRIAWQSTDPFGQLLVSGITFLIATQALINIGVVTSALPNKGISLPFVSYGGSNLLCMLTCLGLLVSVARHAPRSPATERPNPFMKYAKPRAIGPVGSLLAGAGSGPGSGFFRRLQNFLRIGPQPVFPSRSLHSYQKPPTPRRR